MRHQPHDIRDPRNTSRWRACSPGLPAEHPAREAYARGASTIELTHLVADRPEILEALMEIFRAGYRRLRARSGGLRPH